MILRLLIANLLLVCSLAAQPKPLPEEPVDAPEVLRMVRLAIESLPGVSYDFTLSETSTLHPTRLLSTGTVRIRRAAEGLPAAWRVTTTDPSGAPLCDLAFDGTLAVGLDPGAERAFIGPETSAEPLLDLARPALMPALLAPEEFAALTAPDSIALEGRSRIDGVECRILRLRCRALQLDLRLYVGVEDSLPRALERLTREPSGVTTGILLELENLNVAAPRSADLVVSLGSSIRRIALDADPAGTPPLPGSAAPDFTVTDALGHAWELRQWRNSVVVLYFHDPDDPASAASSAMLRALVQRHSESPLRLINIRVLSDDAAPRADDLPGLTVADPGVLTERLAVEAVPTLIIIDREGAIAGTIVGSASEALDEAARMIAATLTPPRRSAEVPTDGWVDQSP